MERKPLLPLRPLSNIPAPRSYSKAPAVYPLQLGDLLLGAWLQFPKEKDLSVR